ncbi:hypothetical protein [Leucobacter manosquensis]|uniref:DUF4853 domain-containing protein n=1 Tax=Leucobacter manosquensis TaxID=2810611 RepID=A0ABS5M3S8_9MICO|nr:hypothetical protein [Leucobacter manosquensis]MBS3181852.1 hypothetical protein [Leucobacter manosquensis]
MAVLAGMVSFSGCAWVGGDVDAAGMTQEEVERLPLERQFDLLGERYEVMQGLLTDAQRVVSPNVWTWTSHGFYPGSGDGQRWSMRGATSKNSYYLSMSRTIRLPGASGAVEDAELMAEYFVAQGWSTTLRKEGARRYQVEAMTDEGYWLDYWVEPNGQYSVGVHSKVYWCNRSELSSAVIDRIPEERFDIEESPPGEFIPFPKWSDPVVPKVG